MGQAPSSEAAAHGTEPTIPTTDWTHQVLAEYSKLHEEQHVATAAPDQPLDGGPYETGYARPPAPEYEKNDKFTRLVWSAEEDDLIMQSVERMGQKWRKISALLPNRSDDAVRNRWQRLVAARANQPAPPTNADGTPAEGSAAGAPLGDRSSVYKCSRCGLPKRKHVCTAPQKMSAAKQAKLKKELAQQNAEGGEPGGEMRAAWTKTEDDIILTSVNEFGPKWVEIAARLPGRTDHAARNRYHRLTSKADAVHYSASYADAVVADLVVADAVQAE